MLELLRQFSCRVRERLDFIFNSSFEAVCLFALFGIVVSVLLLHLHVRLIPPLSISIGGPGAPSQYGGLAKSTESAVGNEGQRTLPGVAGLPSTSAKGKFGPLMLA
jgi:hypothetical protein